MLKLKCSQNDCLEPCGVNIDKFPGCRKLPAGSLFINESCKTSLPNNLDRKDGCGKEKNLVDSRRKALREAV
jgi:hypothetical protein